jgi:N-acetylglutamate synthase-like GNAT family acetyltransferase
MVITRRAAAADAGPVQALIAEAFGIYRPRLGRDPAPMAADYPALINSGRVWVAVQDDEILGVVVLQPEAEHLYLDTIAVRTDAQGRGVGARLMALAEAEAARHDLPAVVLCTNEVMTENLAYYPRRGYRLTHREEQHGFRRVFFRKELPPPAGRR